MRILLWDIDGTLVSTGGAGMRALARAVQAGSPAAEVLSRMRLGGMTDRAIARTLCAAIRHRSDPSLPVEDHAKAVVDPEIDDVLTRYLACLKETLATVDGYQVLPGVHEALERLGARPEVVHALATGNVEEGARLKLDHGNLWRWFRFGGFGSDAEDRADILRAAHRKAEAHLQRSCPVEAFVVIGDTPRDIAAAHRVGMACVAVATGGYDRHELAEHGPDALLDSLLQPGADQLILDARRR